MEEYIWSFIATLIEIAFFAIAYLIEKSRAKEIEDEEKSAKVLKSARNTFYIWTNASIILSILIMVSLACIEWHFVFASIFVFYQIIDFFLYCARLLKKQISMKLFIKKLILFSVQLVNPVILVIYIFSLSSDLQSDAAKPIIYIYPETETTVQVTVGHPEKLSCVYPEYSEEGWKVIVKPNGDLVDTKTGKNLYCLYWEGNQKQEYKFKDGFVVAGEDLAKFLEEKLTILGLNEREANEFIIYWLPKLEANKYNLIRFETMEEIEEYMPLNIEPKPDTLIRVMMDYKGLNKPIEIKEQKLENVTREGYTVVEWGGSEF